MSYLVLLKEAVGVYLHALNNALLQDMISIFHILLKLRPVLD